MGTYLNPSGKRFQIARQSAIYVDKSGLIAQLNKVVNTEQRFVCISRPRRFGKSMAANMIAAYYCSSYDSHGLFSGLRIEGDPSFEEHINKYNVIMLDMTKFLSRAKSGSFDKAEYKPDEDSLVERISYLITKAISDDLIRMIPDFPIKVSDGIVAVLYEAETLTGRPFVFVIDEWDCLFREMQDDAKSQREYLDFIRDLLKDNSFVALAYMTGILPIKKYGKHSALNMFDEFTAGRPAQYGEYLGFTLEETRSVCLDHDMPFEEISDWYNGYLAKGVGRVFSPRSVVAACLQRECRSYWADTETFEALRVYIEMNHTGLRDAVVRLLAGGRERLNTSHFANDMTTFESGDDVLTLLVHLGYLAFDSERSEVFIPNREVSLEYVNAMIGRDWGDAIKAVIASQDCLEATWRGDGEAVAEHVAAVHRETSHLTYNDENALAYTVSLAYYSSRDYYGIFRELPAGDGFADIAFLPKPQHADKPAMIVELKWNKAAVTAIDQIKRKNYPAVLAGYGGEIILVGINYDKQTRAHECVIEKTYS